MNEHNDMTVGGRYAIDENGKRRLVQESTQPAPGKSAEAKAKAGATAERNAKPHRAAKE